MTALDAYAVLAHLRGEAAAESVASLLRSPTVLSALNAAEVVDQLVRVYGNNPDDVHADLEVLAQADMQLADVSAAVPILARRLRARHYDRARLAVSLADCAAAATALMAGLPLATADSALTVMMRAEGGDVHVLPDSAGRLP